MLQLSDWKFKNNYDSYVKGSNGYSRQHAGTDGQCKQRDGNHKKESKRNGRDKKKNTVTEMKDNFDGLISRPNLTELGGWSFQQLVSCEELRGNNSEITRETGHFKDQASKVEPLKDCDLVIG